MRNPTKRARASSLDQTLRAAKNAAAGALNPPRHVRLQQVHRPFWDAIILARARDEWSDNDLVVAAQLARCQYDIEFEERKLQREGKVVKNDRGTKVMNARVAVVEQLARREMALMRSLRMGGRITGDIRDQAGQRAAEKRQRELAEEVAKEDPLLA